MLQKDLVAASSRPVVLSVLARGESYGYEIIQEVRRLSGGRLEYAEGMIYPLLHRLEREGLIKSRWDTPKGTGRRRKYYRLSDDGGAALQAEQQRWITVHNALANLWGLKPCPMPKPI
ncbi:MAG: PadR family transcriptional regulator [Planctomycetota bacterium]